MRKGYVFVDALCVYFTIQYFMLISIFYYATSYRYSTQIDFWIIFESFASVPSIGMPNS